MKTELIIGLTIIVLVSAGLGFLLLSSPDAEMRETSGEQTRAYAEIVNPSGFVNTDSITIGELVGKKVIVVDFMTYSCINCQRTFPYVVAWYEKYKDHGLEVVGIHTPEFAFEKDISNVRAAMERFGITYPVVLDNEYATWNAYGNRYWPRKYLIDIHGNIVYDHIGEGAYEETEQKIQELLEERGAVLGAGGDIRTDIAAPAGAVAVEAAAARSPEIYFGALRNALLGNGAASSVGTQDLSVPAEQQSNILYLGGRWRIADEFAENESGQAKIAFRYQGRNVYFVAGSESGAPIRIFRDGAFAGERTIRDHTLYTLIEDTEPGEHLLEIIIDQPGLRAFTFTFG